MQTSAVRSPSRAAVLVLAAVALTVSASPAGAVPSGWTAPSRAHATHSLVTHDIAVETDGTAHIATQDGEDPGLWYVARVGTTWDRTRITTADDRSPSIALDGFNVVIAFARRDAGQEGIWTATNVTGEWVLERRHAGLDANPSLAVSAGRAHIAFQAPGGALRYVAGPVDDAGSAWIGERVDATCCTSAPSLALTSAGDPRVAYSDGPPGSPGGLALSSRTAGGTWNRTPVASYRVSAPALAVYGTTIHIAYVRRGAGTWYASRLTTSWGFKQIDGGASGPPDLSAFSGSTAFIYGDTGRLRYATMSGGILLSKPFSSAAGDGRPHIVRAGGKPVATWLRRNGGSTDGVQLSRQQ